MSKIFKYFLTVLLIGSFTVVDAAMKYSADSVNIDNVVLFDGRVVTVTTGGGLDINLGTASGDDFTVDTSAFVVKGGTGNVGIGTATPQRALDMQKFDANGDSIIRIKSQTGADNAGVILDTGTQSWWFVNSGPTGGKWMAYDATNAKMPFQVEPNTPSNTVYLKSNGCVGIGTTSPLEPLHVIGDIRSSSLAGTGNRAVYSDADGTLTNSSSDRTMKTNIESLPYGLAETLAMSPIRFNWKPGTNLGDQKEIGFIAQEMEVVVHEVVGMNADGTKSLDYPKLTAVLCKAIQEQQAQIVAQQATINNLNTRIEALEGGN